jgi:predicted lactoylglutathione lyase
MTKEIWINLPVKDAKKSKEFFAKIGFTFKEEMSNDQTVAMAVGTKGTMVMLFAEPIFKGFIGNAPVADTKQGSEVLISFDAESKEEIDALVKKVTDAGGTIYGKPAESQGWLYGFGFVDLDGHRWNGLHMDFSKMPK